METFHSRLSKNSRGQSGGSRAALTQGRALLRSQAQQAEALSLPGDEITLLLESHPGSVAATSALTVTVTAGGGSVACKFRPHRNLSG